MFKPVAMTRLSVVVLERDERTVLRHLGRAGVIQLTRAVAGPETAPLAPRNCSADMTRLERLSLPPREFAASPGTAASPCG